MSLHYADGREIDARAAFYARYREGRPGFHDWVREHLELPVSGAVLDVGCGPADLWRAGPEGSRQGFTGFGAPVLLDLSPGMLADARDRLADLGPLPVRGDAQELPFRDGAFTAVVANHMLYDVEDLHRTLAELRRVLTRGGPLHATTNGGRHLAEFRDALRRAGLRGEFVEKPWHMRFDIDGGARAFGRQFDRVRIHRWNETLHVDDAEPLLAYADSIGHLRARFDDERRRAFREIVECEIAESGTFPVTCESGLLIARA